MIHLDLEGCPGFPAALLEKPAWLTLEQAGRSDVDLTIVLADDAELRRLNAEYMGKDSPTDVLSFAADEVDPETGRLYLGDVILSLDRATEQSAAAGHLVEQEVQLLVVHGVLHLLGYDHGTPDDKNRMWDTQAKVLAVLGLSGLKITE